MKLAILGSTPIALESALRFHEHGAAMTWFNVDPLRASYSGAPMSWEEATTPLGWATLKRGPEGSFTWSAWHNTYYLPLVEYLRGFQEVKPHAVLSITKRFLAPEEEIRGKSRFHDLFRVIYQLNPEEFINQQKENDPATFERLSEEFIQSLQSSLEMYEDFDAILDLREAQEPLSAAISGRALGEGRISKNKMSAGWDALRRASLALPVPELREMCLVGSGDLAAEALLNLKEWLQDPHSRLFVISHEEDPFREILPKAKPALREELLSVFKELEDEFQNEINEFHTRLREWQALDDFIQAKKPRPAEPIPRLVFFSGHNVTAVDELIDRKRIFVTLERPDFREGKRQPENNDLDLKTIGVDEILSANGVTRAPVALALAQNETGYFAYVPKRPFYVEGWKEDLNALDWIEKDLFKLFSPAGTQ